jgi:hypothetical protein
LALLVKIVTGCLGGFAIFHRVLTPQLLGETQKGSVSTRLVRKLGGDRSEINLELLSDFGELSLYHDRASSP